MYTIIYSWSDHLVKRVTLFSSSKILSQFLLKTSVDKQDVISQFLNGMFCLEIWSIDNLRNIFVYNCNIVHVIYISYLGQL